MMTMMTMISSANNDPKEQRANEYNDNSVLLPRSCCGKNDNDNGYGHHRNRIADEILNSSYCIINENETKRTTKMRRWRSCSSGGGIVSMLGKHLLIPMLLLLLMLLPNNKSSTTIVNALILSHHPTRTITRIHNHIINHNHNHNINRRNSISTLHLLPQEHINRHHIHQQSTACRSNINIRYYHYYTSLSSSTDNNEDEYEYEFPHQDLDPEDTYYDDGNSQATMPMFDRQKYTQTQMNSKSSPDNSNNDNNNIGNDNSSRQKMIMNSILNQQKDGYDNDEYEWEEGYLNSDSASAVDAAAALNHDENSTDDDDDIRMPTIEKNESTTTNDSLAAKDEDGETKEPSVNVNGFRSQFSSADEQQNNNNQSSLPLSPSYNQQQGSSSTITAPTTTTSTSNSRQYNTRVPTEQIEAIKSSISLVDVIETYNLQDFTRTGSGGTAKACCPFHNDNNPSMSIDDNRGLYKCFACGAGGDVFNFIREYDYLNGKKRGGKKEKMGYMEAVEYAAKEFGNADFVKDWKFSGGNKNGRYGEGMSEESMEKIRVRERKKDRIRQANTAAAAFYTKCLVTLPTAGKARAHLRGRDISPGSIRTFALGYAPDCYYGDEKKKKVKHRQSSNWGEGSLVEYMANAGFTPEEIVEAGLATQTKKQINGRSGGQVDGSKDGNVGDNSRASTKGHDGATDDNATAEGDSNVDKHDYSGLMDRFRSRLIVPILDANGQDVIALGGRHLESAAADTDNDANDKDDDSLTGEKKEKPSTFIPAKYINSPDSLVFTKKNVFFNQHKAKSAMEEVLAKRNEKGPRASPSSDETTPKNIDTTPTQPSIVIVEGYFDAIALSNVGLRNVVASMGTALPLEQLMIAAEMSNDVPGSKIIFCMDGDDAGQNAVERLCSNNRALLQKVPEMDLNELYVATLPGSDEAKNQNVKDPSDFVSFAGGGDKARLCFQEEVLDKSIPWDEWYVARILSRHDKDAKDGTEGSFADICDVVSTFLATFTNPADRTRRVHKIAEMLVDLIVDDGDNSSSSSLGMLRVQLESDILSMSTRKAGVREAMERRIEQTDGVSGKTVASKIEKLSSGSFDMEDEDDRKMSMSALAKRMPPPRSDVENPREMASKLPRQPVQTRNTYRKPRERRAPPERHLVPHFNGFSFKHQSDRDWLGLSANKNGVSKSKNYLGDTPTPVDEKDRLRAETPMLEESYRPNRKKPDAVYFNSNNYLGQQYLTPEAVRAGYSMKNDDRPSPGESLLDFTQRKVFENEPDQLIMQAESRLLHALAKFSQARSAMRTVYSTSSAFSPSSMRWTSSEGEWLYLCLTGALEVDPPVPEELLVHGTPSELHSYLANRQDCPADAFNKDIFNNSAKNDSPSDSDTSKEEPDESETDAGASASDEVEHEQPDMAGVQSEYEEVDMLEDLSSDEGTTPFLPKGLLDDYFLENEMFPSASNNTIIQETRAELTVQETVATLLRATAMKRFASAKSKLTSIVSEMDRQLLNDGEDDYQPNDNDFDDVSSDELQELFLSVGNEVVEAQKSLYESDRSTDRVNSHLLDYSVTNGVGYKLSQAELERLDKMMDDYVDSLPEDHHRPESPGGEGNYVFGSDEFDGDIDPHFGGRDPSDYVAKGLPNGDISWD